MRCKNCGTENDDNRYICEVCGSPLYDEEDLTPEPENTAAYQQPAAPTPASGQQPVRNPKTKKTDDKTKQSIIIIAVLCIVLIAIIVGIIVAVAGNKDEDKTTTESTTATTEMTENDNNYVTRQTKRDTTTKKETTTKQTTTKKETTTKQTTTKAVCTVTIDVSGYGSVSGDGEYTKNTYAVLTAEPNAGYAFDGWYENGNLVELNTTYRFKVTNDATLEAKFIEVEAPSLD